MLVCNVSLKAPRAAIAADLAEAAAALDSPGTGNVVFATLVDDPASVNDITDAFLGEIMLEAASADTILDANIPASYAVSINETVTASDTQDATLPPPFVTWDSATVSAVTLSGGNLVATNTGTTSTNQGAHVVAASGKTTGKYYFECKVTAYTGGAGVGFGVGTTTAIYSDMSTFPPGDMIFVKGHDGSGPIWATGSNTGFNLGRSLATNDVIGIAVDVTNRRIWYRIAPSGLWNNNIGHDPTFGDGTHGGFAVPAGTIIPFVTFGSSFGGAAGVANNVITANFGATSFTGVAPSGYTAGWPV